MQCPFCRVTVSVAKMKRHLFTAQYCLRIRGLDESHENLVEYHIDKAQQMLNKLNELQQEIDNHPMQDIETTTI